jgi:hypothetical protein
MTETRKVIGVFDVIAAKGVIEFPSVRVWIRGPDDYVTHDVKYAFPSRGTVFLHISACENQHPRLHQVGLFNCIRSTPGESAEWMVQTTSRRLVSVIECPWELKAQFRNLWRWIEGHEEKKPCSILLGESVVYVRTGTSELLGPFSLSEQGKLAARASTFVFKDAEVANVKVAGNRYAFVDVDLLPKGEPIILDPREAILRRLKVIHRSQRFTWLSRDKVQELAEALGNLENADGSEWVMEYLPAALSILCESSDDVEGKLVDALLEIHTIEQAVESAWETKHAELIKKTKGEIEKARVRLAELESRTACTEAELAASQDQKISLQTTLTELQKQTEAAKGEAQRSFDAELKRLAGSPALMAILGTLGGPSSRDDHHQLPIIAQPLSGKHEHVSKFADALVGNFKSCGLSPATALELSMVCLAALVAGQLTSFRSTFSDILAEAMAGALGQPVTFWADVPAGLLDPVNWNSLLDDDQKKSPIVLQAADRSDISLVLGSMRGRLFREALGFEKPSAIVLVTLEARAAMRVENDVPFGPIIDDPVLKFQNLKGDTRIYSCAKYAQQLPEVELLSAEEFATDVGEKIILLPLFSISSNEVGYRRSYSALRAVIPVADDAPRMFFKYWCLPRLSSDAVQSIFEAHKEDWRQDQALLRCMEAKSRDE